MASTRATKRSRTEKVRIVRHAGEKKCTSIIHERFRTTRGTLGAALVKRFRDSICGDADGPSVWVRAEVEGEEPPRRRGMLAQSLWNRRESDRGLYMVPASIKPVVKDVVPYYPNELNRDVLRDHDGFLYGGGKDPSNLEFLVGARESKSSLHRDGGLVSWVTIEVLEGKKRVAVMPREWMWRDGDGELDWVAIERLCETEGGYSTVLGPGEAITFWSDAPHAALNEEPTLSLSFAWLEEDLLLGSLIKTLSRELECRSARWVQARFVGLIERALRKGFDRFRTGPPGTRVHVFKELGELYCLIQRCLETEGILTKKAFRGILQTMRKEFFRKL